MQYLQATDKAAYIGNDGDIGFVAAGQPIDEIRTPVGTILDDRYLVVDNVCDGRLIISGTGRGTRLILAMDEDAQAYHGLTLPLVLGIGQFEIEHRVYPGTYISVGTDLLLLFTTEDIDEAIDEAD